jgi:hypothetical protein
VRRRGVQAHRRPPLQRRVRADDAPCSVATTKQLSASVTHCHIRFLNTIAGLLLLQGASAQLDGRDAGDLGGDGGGRPHRVSHRAQFLFSTNIIFFNATAIRRITANRGLKSEKWFCFFQLFGDRRSVPAVLLAGKLVDQKAYHF